MQCIATRRVGLLAVCVAVSAACAEIRDSGGDPPSPGPAPALSLEYDPEPVLPRQPRQFEIELTRGACHGDCPSYRAAIDQDGKVSFFGQRCVVRPGSSRRQVEPEDARAVYDALIAARYPSFGDRYVDEADGCQLVSDAPTQLWKVRADGRYKSLKHYAGCLGVEGLEMVRAVERLLLERADLLDDLEPAYPQCDSGSHRIPDSRFVMRVDDVALGVLQVRVMYGAPRFFELFDCSSALLARGDAHSERARIVLLDGGRGTITLPRRLGEAASLILEFEEPGQRRFDSPAIMPESGHALREGGDIAFTLQAGDSCE
jgi:hypothetical protein